MALTTWDEQRWHADYAAAIAKNGARNGRSLHRIGSKGAGQTRIVKPITLQLTFVAEPIFTTGLALASGQLVDGAYPIATVGVSAWQKDNRGFFIGAYIWISVSYGATRLVGDDQFTYDKAIAAAVAVRDGTTSLFYEAANTQLQSAIAQASALNALELDHHLCFEGMALRDVNYDKIMADG